MPSRRVAVVAVSQCFTVQSMHAKGARAGGPCMRKPARRPHPSPQSRTPAALRLYSSAWMAWSQTWLVRDLLPPHARDKHSASGSTLESCVLQSAHMGLQDASSAAMHPPLLLTKRQCNWVQSACALQHELELTTLPSGHSRSTAGGPQAASPRTTSKSKTRQYTQAGQHAESSKSEG